MTRAAQHSVHTPIVPPSPVTQEGTLSHFAHRRAAIDMIATLRARMIRCALFSTFLLRPHPITPETDETRDHWRERFEEQYNGILRSYALLDGNDPMGIVPEDILEWIASCVAEWPEQRKVLDQMLELTKTLRNSLTLSHAEMDAAMKAHFVLGPGKFYDAVTTLCDGLWAQLDHQRNSDMVRAKENGNAIDDILERLERIGKHVRLVSLNASVEAARVGDAGRGLGVIAVEFKSLAEEIQHLAATARNNIDGMTTTSG